MKNLLEVYNDMLASQNVQEQEKVAEAQVASEVDERMEVLTKYAQAADNALAAEFGEDYEEEDVIKLAQLMINHDIEQEEAMEKVAEAYQMGVIMARGFKAEMSNE